MTEGEAEVETCFLASKFYTQNRSGQEIKVMTSFGHSVKNPEVAMVQLSSWNQKTNMDLTPAV